MFKWDLNYLIRLRDEFKNKIDYETNKEKIKQLELTVGSIEAIIDFYVQHYEEPDSFKIDNYDSFSENKQNLKSIILDDKVIFKKYSSYKGLLINFKNNLDSLVINPKFNLPKINMGKGYLLRISNEFYSLQNGKIAEIFAKIKHTLPTHLIFRNIPRKSESLLYEYAQTFPIYGTSESFYSVGLCHTADDYISIIHELGHGIANFINPNYLWDFNRYCLAEVDTLFWELVGYDFLEDNLGLVNDSFQMRLIALKDYYYDADLMCSKLELYQRFSAPSLYNKSKLKTYLKEKIGYDNFTINQLLSTSVKTDFHYIISFLIAVELYLIYIVDKNIALDLLLKIMKVKGRSADGYLEYVNSLGIIPGEHIKDYVDILINKSKVLGKSKQLYYQN